MSRQKVSPAHSNRIREKDTKVLNRCRAGLTLFRAADGRIREIRVQQVQRQYRRMAYECHSRLSFCCNFAELLLCSVISLVNPIDYPFLRALVNGVQQYTMLTSQGSLLTLSISGPFILTILMPAFSISSLAAPHPFAPRSTLRVASSIT